MTIQEPTYPAPVFDLDRTRHEDDPRHVVEQHWHVLHDDRTDEWTNIPVRAVFNLCGMGPLVEIGPWSTTPHDAVLLHESLGLMLDELAASVTGDPDLDRRREERRAQDLNGDALRSEVAELRANKARFHQAYSDLDTFRTAEIEALQADVARLRGVGPANPNEERGE